MIYKKTNKSLTFNILFAAGSIFILMRAIEKGVTVFMWVGGIFAMISILQVILYLRKK
jgi:hypothetical protein